MWVFADDDCHCVFGCWVGDGKVVGGTGEEHAAFAACMVIGRHMGFAGHRGRDCLGEAKCG
jgi:hypothetical protein